jgi:uncharacterized protein (DUF1697 family)
MAATDGNSREVRVVPLRVALLRGINVAGKTRIGMADLRELFTGLGHTSVATYLQSGNVVFEPAPGGDAGVAARLVAEIEARLGVKVSVLLRTGADLGRVLDGNPYLDREKDPAKLHVTFLEREPAAGQAARLEIPPGETATFTLAGPEVFLHCPDGYGRTKLNNAYLERRLGTAATTRNWKTVNALHEMAGGGEPAA